MRSARPLCMTLKDKVDSRAASPLAANDLRVHVGLGASPHVDGLILHWPGGKVLTLHNLSAGYLHVISEDQGVLNSAELAVKPAVVESSR